MHIARSRLLVVSAVVFAALVLLAIACNGGDDEPAVEMATATSTPVPTPAGFLPRPPGRPTHGPGDPALRRCPPLPLPDCYREGTRVNVYTALSMSKAVALRVETDGQERWILDEAALQEALKPLDEEVVLSEVDVEEFLEEERIDMTIVWPPGQGIRWSIASDDTLRFVLSPATGFIAHGLTLLQSPLPEGFVDRILASARDVTPTPRPEETVPPSERANDGIYFDHPEGELIWDGPDDRLSSLPGDRAHCRPASSLVYLFGIPSIFTTDDDFDSAPSFYSYRGAAEPSDDWRWTGYYHDAWQLWQGDDPWTVYLVHPDEDRFAFVYQAYPCP